jgi:serine/threonine protein kinase
MNSDDDPTHASGPNARAADTIMEEPGSRGLVYATVSGETLLGYDERYVERRLLGRGGMGEVRLCLDTKVGREVAVKVLRPEKSAGDSRAKRRFLREGRVQAQLEHPGVVPIYDLGTTPSGAPFMAMKRIGGATLEAVLHGLRTGDPEIAKRHPRASLLFAVERICETVAYAHARGVVHRDLKPANVMLGDYGEVSVLDWGLSKLQGDSDLDPAGVEIAQEEFTVPGSIIGTVSYMAPEQATGDPVDAAADVYALGAILYEAITLDRLHPSSTLDERLASSLRGVDPKPSAKVAGVAPELDAICARATKILRSERYPSARELLDDLRGVLEGQRATQLRREMAEEHAEAARAKLSRPRASETTRITALRDLSAAAVLDPDNKEMVRMIEELLSPAAGVPSEVERELQKTWDRSASRATGRSAVAYAAALALIPVISWMGVRDWATFGILTAGLVFSAIAAVVMAWRGRARGMVAWIAAPFAFALVSALGSLFGSFVLVPTLAVTTCVAFTVSVRPSRALQRFLLVGGIAAILGPFALSALGLVEPSLRFEDGVIEIVPHLASFPELPTTVLLVVANVFLVTASTLLVGRAVDSRSAAERRLAVQAHRLRAMLPS